MDDRTRIENYIKTYWRNGQVKSFRLAKNSVRSVSEGMELEYSEITTGRVLEGDNEVFVPLARDYWNDNKCVPIEEMSPSMFWKMYNKMVQDGFYNKVMYYLTIHNLI